MIFYNLFIKLYIKYLYIYIFYIIVVLCIFLLSLVSELFHRTVVRLPCPSNTSSPKFSLTNSSATAHHLGCLAPMDEKDSK